MKNLFTRILFISFLLPVAISSGAQENQSRTESPRDFLKAIRTTAVKKAKIGGIVGATVGATAGGIAGGVVVAAGGLVGGIATRVPELGLVGAAVGGIGGTAVGGIGGAAVGVVVGIAEVAIMMLKKECDEKQKNAKISSKKLNRLIDYGL